MSSGFQGHLYSDQQVTNEQFTTSQVENFARMTPRTQDLWFWFYYKGGKQQPTKGDPKRKLWEQTRSFHVLRTCYFHITVSILRLTWHLVTRVCIGILSHRHDLVNLCVWTSSLASLCSQEGRLMSHGSKLQSTNHMIDISGVVCP